MIKPALVRKAGVTVLLAAGYALLLTGLLALGPHVSPPGEREMSPEAGSMNSALHQLLGRGGDTDFLIDYASANALAHAADPYDVSSRLIEAVGRQWDVSTANPHPPTLLPLVLLFTLVKYEWALAAWALAMIGAFIMTMRLMGLRLAYAISLGVAMSLVFPGAYAIGNPVPLIGLGVALAYRNRNQPIVAGLGVTLATVPKISGMVLLIPFLLSRRFRSVAYALAFLALVAAVPFALYPKLGSRYLDAGLKAAKISELRPDNAALLNLGGKWGIPTLLTMAIIGVATVLIVAVRREVFWPTAWLMVAALPIAWMYSLLTFLPLAIWVVRRSSTWATALVITATGLTVASPPLGRWPVAIFPTVLFLLYLSLWSTKGRESTDFSFRIGGARSIVRKRALQPASYAPE